MRKIFCEKSWKDYAKWAETDAVITGKINSLLRTVEESGSLQGGTPADAGGVIYVLNIDEMNQLAIRQSDDMLEILSCKGQFQMQQDL
ncbi:MAG: type II toxin-antitoxin system YoeB family toxin [Lachnospiraceae bacterium]|nr:type II toxin-antitoxin system YoeB family toxin [Lachnospiraceae bacterium]